MHTLRTTTRTLRLLPLILLAGLLLAGSAAAGTMIFAPPFTSGYANFVEDGLRLTSNGPMYLYTTTQSMYPSPSVTILTLTLADGGPFTLVSMDIGSRYANTPVTIVFTGNLVGGGTVETTMATTSATAFELETFMFPASFTNLASVTWGTSDPAWSDNYDNIVAVESPVPVEPTTWGRVKSLYPGR